MSNDLKIFVGNLPFTATSEDLKNLFQRYGNVVGINLRKDRMTDKPRGFGFITFETSESATTAISEANGMTYCDRQLTVNSSESRGKGKVLSEEDKAKIEKDNEWKTSPTPKKNSNNNSINNKDNKNYKDSNNSKRKTWDHWAGPV